MLVSALVLVMGLQAAPMTPEPVVAPDSIPKSTCVEPHRTGTFRVVATRTDGKAGAVALLLLENIGGCLEATFVTDDRGPAAIDRLSMSPSALQGRLHLTGEAATFTVRFEDNRVAGSIIGRKQEWRLEGRKTG